LFSQIYTGGSTLEILQIEVSTHHVIFVLSHFGAHDFHETTLAGFFQAVEYVTAYIFLRVFKFVSC
jgi:hypothetical protein